MLELLRTLKPSWWFSAHLHVKYAATFPHASPGAATTAPVANPDEIEISLGDENENEGDDKKATDVQPSTESAEPIPANPDEIILGDEVDDVEVHATVPGDPGPKITSVTNFLALDKCLPRRQYLEVLDIPSEPRPAPGDEPSFMFDPEWLAITRAAHPFLTSARLQGRLPAPKATQAMVAKELEWVMANIGEKSIESVQTFTMTAPGPEQRVKGQCRPNLSRFTQDVPDANTLANSFTPSECCAV